LVPIFCVVGGAAPTLWSKEFWSLIKAFPKESVEVCEENLQLTAPQWKQVKELQDMLKKSYMVMKNLQL